MNSSGTLRGAADDDTAEITGHEIVMTAWSGGIGGPSAGSAIDLLAHGRFSADTASRGDGGDINIDSLGDLMINEINAGAGNGGAVTINSIGSIQGFADDFVPDIWSDELHLIAGTGGTGWIGGRTAGEAINVIAVSNLTADTTASNGDVIIDFFAILPPYVIDAGTGNTTVDLIATNLAESLANTMPDVTATATQSFGERILLPGFDTPVSPMIGGRPAAYFQRSLSHAYNQYFMHATLSGSVQSTFDPAGFISYLAAQPADSHSRQVLAGLGELARSMSYRELDQNPPTGYKARILTQYSPGLITPAELDAVLHLLNDSSFSTEPQILPTLTLPQAQDKSTTHPTI